MVYRIRVEGIVNLPHQITAATTTRKEVGFTSFFPCFAGSDVLIQCMSTTTNSLSTQTSYYSYCIYVGQNMARNYIQAECPDVAHRDEPMHLEQLNENISKKFRGNFEIVSIICGHPAYMVSPKHPFCAKSTYKKCFVCFRLKIGF